MRGRELETEVELEGQPGDGFGKRSRFEKRPTVKNVGCFLLV